MANTYIKYGDIEIKNIIVRGARTVGESLNRGGVTGTAPSLEQGANQAASPNFS